MILVGFLMVLLVGRRLRLGLIEMMFIFLGLIMVLVLELFL